MTIYRLNALDQTGARIHLIATAQSALGGGDKLLFCVWINLEHDELLAKGAAPNPAEAIVLAVAALAEQETSVNARRLKGGLTNRPCSSLSHQAGALWGARLFV